MIGSSLIRTDMRRPFFACGVKKTFSLTGISSNKASAPWQGDRQIKHGRALARGLSRRLHMACAEVMQTLSLAVWIASPLARRMGWPLKILFNIRLLAVSVVGSALGLHQERPRHFERTATNSLAYYGFVLMC